VSLKLLLFSIATLGTGVFLPSTWAEVSQLLWLDHVFVRAGSTLTGSNSGAGGSFWEGRARVTSTVNGSNSGGAGGNGGLG